MKKAEFLKVVEAYVLGSVEPQIEAEVEAFLKTDQADEECLEALRHAQDVANELSGSLPPVEPSKAVWERIEDSMGEEAGLSLVKPGQAPGRQRKPRSSISPIFAKTIPWAAAAIGIAVGFLLKGDLTQSQDQMNRVASVLEQPGSRVIALKATGVGAYRGTAIVNNGSLSLFWGRGLFPIDGKDYQLWVKKGEAWASVGVIPVENNGQGMIEASANGQTFAVSIERKGGESSPKGKVILVSDE